MADTTYCFKGKGPALPYDSMFAVLKRNINLPALIATDYGKLALLNLKAAQHQAFVQDDVGVGLQAGFILILGPNPDFGNVQFCSIHDITPLFVSR